MKTNKVSIGLLVIVKICLLLLLYMHCTCAKICHSVVPTSCWRIHLVWNKTHPAVIEWLHFHHELLDANSN